MFNIYTLILSQIAPSITDKNIDLSHYTTHHMKYNEIQNTNYKNTKYNNKKCFLPNHRTTR